MLAFSVASIPLEGTVPRSHASGFLTVLMPNLLKMSSFSSSENARSMHSKSLMSTSFVAQVLPRALLELFNGFVGAAGDSLVCTFCRLL